MPRWLLIGWMVLALALGPSLAAAEKRVALVIGNNAYANLAPDQQLRRAVNDARAVGDALGRLGFDVILGANLNRQELVEKLDELTRRLSPGDTAFFFFAGHGVSIGGANYILPTDVPNVQAGQEVRLARTSIGEGEILSDLQARGVRVAVLVLDACRNNPVRRPGERAIGGERGLVRSEPVRGVFSLYSAGIGQTALDRLGDADANANSVFTRVLVPALTKPGLDLSALAVEVREEVARLARTIGHDQRPAYYDETIGGRVYLAGLPAAVDNRGPDEAERAWNATKDTTSIALLEEFARRYAASFYAAHARARIEELRRSQVAVAPPAQQVVPPAAPPAAVVAPIREFKGHTETVISIAFSTDGRHIISASADKTMRLWDVASGTSIRRFAGHAEFVASAALFPDGQRIVSGSHDDTARIWDANTGNVNHVIKHSRDVNSVAVSPDGKQVVSASDDRTIRLSDAQSGKLIHELNGHSQPVWRVAFSPNGRQILSGSADGTLRLWDASTGTLLHQLNGHASAVRSLAFSRDGRHILSGSEDKTVRLWDAASGTLIRQFTGHSQMVLSVAFSPDGRYILSGSTDQTLRLSDATSGALVRAITVNVNDAVGVFSPDGRHILTTGADNILRLRDAGIADGVAGAR